MKNTSPILTIYFQHLECDGLLGSELLSLHMVHLLPSSRTTEFERISKIFLGSPQEIPKILTFHVILITSFRNCAIHNFQVLQ